MGSVSMQSQAGSRGERMSAFVDGESLDELGNISQFLSELKNEDRAAWSEYHLIGDALRSDDLAVSPATSSAFMASFSQRFEAEVHMLAPAALSVLASAKSRAGMLRRRVVPAFAVAAAAATLTWIVVPQLQGVDSRGGAQIASVAPADSMQRVAMASIPAATARPAIVEANIIRDANLDQYLEAHQQFSQQPVVPGSMPLIRAAATTQGQ
ncbi:anti sigma-E protein, RseA [Caballeronia arationis]|uniref:Anti sigma-E protein, RseA n=1 Tax=Caballeronia arationis TaxID=1777142 RepID=A0A7Z7N4E7_9BURK|nr:sigma-E factor negative regulatory protein [Caballeronia arationis]SAK55653.1 anti sigma-E protein, RseA [Caballeronia arationis]SOE81073.1 anti sigma-E protein, RseA [Caballeronia arationis]